MYPTIYLHPTIPMLFTFTYFYIHCCWQWCVHFQHYFLCFLQVFLSACRIFLLNIVSSNNAELVRSSVLTCPLSNVQHTTAYDLDQKWILKCEKGYFITLNRLTQMHDRLNRSTRLGPVVTTRIDSNVPWLQCQTIDSIDFGVYE